MSTMDIIKLHGGEPANFLDVGGGANEPQVTEAFRILLSDPNVKACWSTSSAASPAARRSPTRSSRRSKEVGFNVPLVVRLEGTEVEEGRKILAKAA
jgi:succinyl-CoA synthetase beta subunit